VGEAKRGEPAAPKSFCAAARGELGNLGATGGLALFLRRYRANAAHDMAELEQLEMLSLVSSVTKELVNYTGLSGRRLSSLLHGLLAR
jgi:hypothetical protein